MSELTYEKLIKAKELIMGADFEVSEWHRERIYTWDDWMDDFAEYHWGWKPCV